MSKRREKLRARYIACIGYDPYLDDPSITDAEVEQTLDEWQDAARPADSINTEELDALAKAARPIDDADYGSERQEAAWAAFFDVADKLIPKSQRRAFDVYCLKATSDEIVEEAMRIIRKQRA